MGLTYRRAFLSLTEQRGWYVSILPTSRASMPSLLAMLFISTSVASNLSSEHKGKKKTYSILPLAKNQTTKVSHLRAQSKERNSSCMRTAHLGDVGLGGNALLPGLRGEQGRDAFPRVALRCHCHAAFSDPPALDGCCSLVVAAPAGKSAVASSIYYPGSGIWTSSITGAFAISLSLSFATSLRHLLTARLNIR